MTGPRAVIWDMDGVITDTAPLHYRAWQEMARRRGRGFSTEDFRHTFGLRNENIIAFLFGEGLSAEEVQRLAMEKEECFRSVAQGDFRVFPGVQGLLEGLRAEGYRMAIASSAPPENIALIVERLGIGHFFQAVVSDRDVTAGKPDPQVFTIAAQRLGVPATRAVVIEDAVSGVAAARAAGMRCIAVTTTNPRESLAQADLVVDSLEQVSVDTVESLLAWG